uniref:Uncharacterized protein n=1 Tax=viral metagenome TaxID=1070528 RepID=A0A6M3IVT0_9ZZZZ
MEWVYKIYMNNTLVDSSPLSGIALLKFEDACRVGTPALRREYAGLSFDPVIHGTTEYNPLDGGWDCV